MLEKIKPYIFKKDWDGTVIINPYFVTASIILVAVTVFTAFGLITKAVKNQQETVVVDVLNINDSNNSFALAATEKACGVTLQGEPLIEVAYFGAWREHEWEFTQDGDTTILRESYSLWIDVDNIDYYVTVKGENSFPSVYNKDGNRLFGRGANELVKRALVELPPVHYITVKPLTNDQSDAFVPTQVQCNSFYDFDWWFLN